MLRQKFILNPEIQKKQKANENGVESRIPHRGFAITCETPILCFANSFKKIVGDAGGLITDQGRHRLNKTPPPNGEQLTVRPEKRQTL